MRAKMIIKSKKIYFLFIFALSFLTANKAFCGEIPINTIIIQKGDTLSALALKYNTTISVLLALNPKIKNPDLIFAGDTLKVPPPTKKIVIKPGDTLSSLALEYNTTIESLLALNPKIKNPNLIIAGDILEVPLEVSKEIPLAPSTPLEATPTATTTTQATTTQATTTEITPTLSVNLSANPSSGNAPLYGVDLVAQVSGTATGSINYVFYCDRSDSGNDIVSGWCQKKEGIEETSFTAVDCCNFTSPGNFTAKVIVQRGNLSAEARITINITSPPTFQPPSSPPSSQTPPSPPPSCQDQYPSGEQIYSVTTKEIPKISQIVINPLNVGYLSSQTVSASISDPNGNPITQVEGKAITDNKVTNFTLSLISGTETSGTWQGTWTLTDSICQNYQVAIVAQSQSGTSKVVLTFK